MAAPTQAYPPWLSPVPTTITQDGAVVVQTSVVQEPQTYYGPSIPLDSDWVYGGSTFPASIATSFATPLTSTPSTSASPTTSPPPTSSQSQTTPSTSSSVSSTPSSISSTQSSVSSSLIPSSSAFASPSAGNPARGLSAGSRIAIILSTVIGVLMLAALLAVVLRIRRRARRHGLAVGGLSWSFISHSLAQQQQQQQHPALDEEDGGEAGNEQDAFLPQEPSMEERPQRPPIMPRWPSPPPHSPTAPVPTALVARPGPGSVGTKSDSSTLDSDAKREDIARFNASSSTADGGSLFFSPRRGTGELGRPSDEGTVDEPAQKAGATVRQLRNIATRPAGAAAPQIPSPSRSGSIVSPSVLQFQPASSRSIDDHDGLYDSDVQRLHALRVRESLDAGPGEQLRPPRPLDADNVRTSQHSAPGSRKSWVYPDSPPSETDERATLLTARRVNIGPTTRPTPDSSPMKRKSREQWLAPLDDEEKRPRSRGSWTLSIGGLSALAMSLGRMSWFRRMDKEAGPSGTRHSSPARSRHGPDSRPPSMTVLVPPGSASRPSSGLLRPQSGLSFRSGDAELGVRPSGKQVQASVGGSGSGSGKSAGTVYHSVSSRPRTPLNAAAAEHLSSLAQSTEVEPTMVMLPPDLDLGEGVSTVRSVDVLDTPIPERSLPFSPAILPDTSSRSTKQDTLSSKGTGSRERSGFPPGLVSIQKWDKYSHSGSSNREARDLLEDEPPQAGGEWSSLRSKASASDVKETNVDSARDRPVARRSAGEQPVQVVLGEPADSETASISPEPRQFHDQSNINPSVFLRSPRSLATFGLSLTPQVSVHGSSSEGGSHSADGSHSSRPSHATSHSHVASQPSSNHESDDGHPPASQGAGYDRASLSAIGGVEGPPQLPPMRPLSNMQSMLERTEEDRENESSDPSRPGTGTSRPMTETTHTGTTFTGSTGVLTAVASTTGWSEKR